MKAEDRLEISLKEKRARMLSFLLNSGLKINRVLNLKTGQSLQWTEASSSGHLKNLNVFVRDGEEPLSLSISYEGRIYDPVVKERDLQFVKGDQTSGLIGQEGVYLSSSTGWYPDRPDSIASFKIEAVIPVPYRIVTEGDRLSEELKAGSWKSIWSYDLPTEGFTLVAGRYSIRSRDVDGIRVSTYFFPEDDRFSEVFLVAAEEYLKIYSSLLGPYPYKKFDIVQNFFSSGYSFPTFTLLAPDAIRQGREFLRPGALDHEIVHSWWGHSVSLRAGTGNWCEALTAYCTNYYYKELKLGTAVARKHRQEVMQKYAVQVPHSKDYPLRQFEGKGDEMDGQIGYGKGSMVFHMLRKIVGRDLFFATLRDFSKEYRGKQANWEDIKKVFEEASGRKLDWFFSQWLDRPGGPQLKLEGVRYQVTPKGYLISGEVVQQGDVYQLTLPVEVDEGTGRKSILLEVSKKRNPFALEIQKFPLGLAIDPNGHLFRRLYPQEISPGLNAFLEGRKKVFVIPDQGDEESKKLYAELAEVAKERKGGKILSVGEVTEAEALNSSLMLFGDSWKAPIFSKLISNLPSPIRFKNGTFVVKSEKVDEEDESLLLTYPHPFRSGKWITIYFGISPASLSRGRFIFFYGWDSYLLFKKGRPVERGSFPPRTSFVSYDVLSKGHLEKIEPERMKEHLNYLVSPESAGRLPGTPGYREAQAYLVKQLEGMGISPIIQPFSITVKEIEEAKVILERSKGEEKVEAIPLLFSKEGEWKGTGIFLEGEEAEKGQDLQGKMILLSYSKLDGERAENALFRKIERLQLRGAAAILVIIKEEDLDGLSSYVTYPSYFPPRLREKLKNREKEGGSAQRWVEAARVVARGKDLDFSIQIPILFLPYSQGDEGWMKTLFEEKEVFLRIGLRFKKTRIKDSNIVGVIQGSGPGKREEFLVLGAHLDHLGREERSGSFFPGADDNGSGVAALLEIGRSFMGRRSDLRRNILLLFFGGEEWGLWGSRYFVRHPIVPLAEMKAMFSLDSIGGIADEKEVFLVGGTVYPSLAQRSRRFLEPLGLKEGREIDRYAFAFGSDHYPFHQAGIPCLDVFASDQKKLHTLNDNLASIDFEKLADVARWVYLTAYEFLTEP